MIITVGNIKGGVGKTTLALNIAVASALMERKVWLVDGDAQATATQAVQFRSEAGQKPILACAAYTNGSALRTQVKLQAEHFDDVIIDAGGRDSGALRAALSISDVLLVPFQPRSYDVWSLADIVKLIEEAKSMREGLRAYAVLNLADPGLTSSDNTEAAEAVADYPELELLETPIRRRKAFANAAGRGLSVLESTPRDEKACAEIMGLISYLFDIQKTSIKTKGNLHDNPSP